MPRAAFSAARSSFWSRTSTSGDAGTAVQKARKLIDRDNVDFLVGNINSALAQAIANVSYEKKIFHVVPGGHTDSVTGVNCHWDVFRICNTTQMEANAVASTLIKTAGKKWYYLTPDYAFGHTLQAGLEKAAAKLGGTKLGGDLTPLGTTDFSSYLIKAQAASPDVIIFLQAGDDAVNALKQAVQFGLDKKFHLAGAQQELEVLLGLPPEARIGTWVFEWYWKQPNVPHVNEFVAEIRKKSGGHVPTARTWFGFAAIHTCALAAAEGEVARRCENGKGNARLQAAAGSVVDAGRRILPRGPGSTHPRPLCRPGPIERRRRPRGPLQGGRSRQGCGRRRNAGGDRLQADVAELTTGSAGRRSKRGARNSG